MLIQYCISEVELFLCYFIDISREYLTLLTLCILMDYSIQIKAIRMGLSIIYFKGSQVVPNYNVFLSLRIVFM